MSEGAERRGTDNRSADRPANPPAILETGKGPTVVYNGRALYSRHDPSRDPLKAVASLAIPDETLVLCVSPLLGYGLAPLLEKLPATSLVLALERDESLMSLSVSAIDERILKHPRFRYVRTASRERVVEYVDSLGLGPFRRCMRVDLSAGASLETAFYAETTRLVDDYISRCWRNHVTLMRLGRSYARDFFANVGALGDSRPIERGMAAKPVLVAGAGPSLDGSLDFIRANRDRVFVLAVDTALGTLERSGVGCDAVIVVESQFWIERAFAGLRDSRVAVFADLTARPAAVSACSGEISFFLSEYARTRFIARFLPHAGDLPVIPPLGSVGLAALYLSRLIAPIGSRTLVTGLDFSFGKGLTHARGAPSSIEHYARTDRLSPVGSHVPSLASGAYEARGKDGGAVCTDRLLSGYASLCASYFAGTKTDFMDIGVTGLDTGLPRATPDEAAAYLGEYDATAREIRPAREVRPARGERSDTAESSCDDERPRGGIDATAIRAQLEEEYRGLALARGIMTGELTEAEAGTRLDDILRERDYLYLHFPDGYRGYSNDPAFLRRVRVEIDYFMKTISNALAENAPS